MKVAIPGGTGLIGRHLADTLAGSGHEPIILTRKLDRAAVTHTQRRWQPEQLDLCVEALAGVDAVVNLAGAPIDAGRWTRTRKQRIRDSRVLGTRRLVEALALASDRPRVLIAGSAVGYYGSRGDDILDEHSTAGRDFLAQVCVDLEAEADRATALDIRVVAIRTGVVLAADGGALRRMLPPFRLGLGGRLGHGHQWLPWIHVDDLVAIIVACLENETLAGAVNGTSPAAATNRQFTVALGAALGRPTPFPLPGAALRLLFGEMSSILTASQRVMPRRLLASGFTFRYEALADALQACLHA